MTVSAATLMKQSPGSVSDDALRRFLGYRLKRAHNVLHAGLVRALEPFGLRVVSYSALLMIVENPGLRQSQLADALSIERPNMVLSIDELEKRKLIERHRDPEDRRAYALRPTPAGERLIAKATAAVEAHEREATRRLTPEDREAAFRILQLLTETD